MPPEQVTEFEKICLTSDVQLAEVASAHQILALVLGERAEVDPKLRRRMYAIPEQELALAAHKEDQEAGEEVAVHTAEPRVTAPRKRRRPEIPEWLRDKPKRQFPWVPLTIAAALVVVASVVTYALLVTPPAQVAEVASREPTPNLAPSAPENEGQAALSTAPPENQGVEAPSEPVGNLEAPPEAVADTPVEPASEAEPEAPSAVEKPAGAAAPIAARDHGMPPDAPLRPATRDDNAFDTEIPPEESAAMPAAGESRNALNDPVLLPEAERPGASEGAQPGEPIAVGRLANDSEVLLHGSGAAGDWQRVSTRDALLSDDELVALPTFRPGVALSTGGGAIAHLLGGSVVRLVAPDANGVPGLHIVDGQVVVATAGKPGTQLNLQIGDQIYSVTFLAPDARIAVDVRRWLADGADPIDQQATPTADLYVPNGEIEYLAAGAAQGISLKAPTMRTLIAKTGSDGIDTSNEVVFPPWINGNPLSQVEKWAADAVNKELVADDPTGQPLLAHLRELSQNRRVEVRNLAVLCLSQLGDFEGLLPLLNDEKQRTNWTTQIEAARRAMLRSPQVAQQLQATLAS
ncbi:MAG: hypothetical protein ABUL64_01360, partial [Singulisphaera sp.]